MDLVAIIRPGWSDFDGEGIFRMRHLAKVFRPYAEERRTVVWSSPDRRVLPQARILAQAMPCLCDALACLCPAIAPGEPFEGYRERRLEEIHDALIKKQEDHDLVLLVTHHPLIAMLADLLVQRDLRYPPWNIGGLFFGEACVIDYANRSAFFLPEDHGERSFYGNDHFITKNTAVYV